MQSIVASCFHPLFPIPEAQNDRQPALHWLTSHAIDTDWRIEIGLSDHAPWLRLTHLPSAFVSYWEYCGEQNRAHLKRIIRQNGEDVPPELYSRAQFTHHFCIDAWLAAEPPRKS